MQQRIRTLAGLYIVAAVTAWFTLTIMLMKSMTMLINGPAMSDQLAAFVVGFVSAMPIFIPVLVGAVGLLYRRRWARSLMIFVSVLGIFLFFLIVPFLLGVFGMIVLGGPDAKEYFGEPVTSSLDQPADHQGVHASA
jgi:hypothetical protein